MNRESINESVSFFTREFLCYLICDLLFFHIFHYAAMNDSVTELTNNLSFEAAHMHGVRVAFPYDFSSVFEGRLFLTFMFFFFFFLHMLRKICIHGQKTHINYFFSRHPHFKAYCNTHI